LATGAHYVKQWDQWVLYVEEKGKWGRKNADRTMQGCPRSQAKMRAGNGQGRLKRCV